MTAIILHNTPVTKMGQANEGQGGGVQAIQAQIQSITESIRGSTSISDDKKQPQIKATPQTSHPRSPSGVENDPLPQQKRTPETQHTSAEPDTLEIKQPVPGILKENTDDEEEEIEELEEEGDSSIEILGEEDVSSPDLAVSLV